MEALSVVGFNFLDWRGRERHRRQRIVVLTGFVAIVLIILLSSLVASQLQEKTELMSKASEIAQQQIVHQQVLLAKAVKHRQKLQADAEIQQQQRLRHKVARARLALLDVLSEQLGTGLYLGEINWQQKQLRLFGWAREAKALAEFTRLFQTRLKLDQLQVHWQQETDTQGWRQFLLETELSLLPSIAGEYQVETTISGMSDGF